MEILLIRHGLPEKIVNEDGSPADPPLSEIGHSQAGKMAAWLRELKIDRLYSSPMRRALQTAKPLAGKLGLEVEVRDGVAEYDQKSTLYIPVEQLKELDYDRWLRLMKGEMESDFPEFALNVISTIEAIVGENKGKRVAVTCHGGVMLWVLRHGCSSIRITPALTALWWRAPVKSPSSL